MLKIDKPDKVPMLPEQYLSEFWPPFIREEFEEYEIDDIFFAFEALKTLCIKYCKWSENAEILIKEPLFLQGALTGVLITLDEFPLPEYVETKKLVKIRAIMCTYFDQLKNHLPK